MKKITLMLILVIIFSACTNNIPNSNKSETGENKIESKNKEDSFAEIDKSVERAILKLTSKIGNSKNNFGIGKVIGNNDIPEFDRVIADSLEKNLLKYSVDKYKVVDRENIAEILEEWKLGNSGMINEENSLQTGKLLGINMLIFAKYSFSNDMLTLTIKAVNTETGEIAALETESAEVKYKSENKPEINVVAELSESGGKRIKIWSDKESYSIGEKIKIYFKASEDCYLTLIDISPAGDVTVIYPNKYSGGNFVKSGQEYQITAENMGFEIEASEPKGTEIIRAIASKEAVINVDKFLTYGDGNPFGEMKGDFTEFTRGLKIVEKKTETKKWDEQILKISIK